MAKKSKQPAEPDDDYETARQHCRYEWDCPYCSEVNDSGELDRSGDVVACEFCEGKVLLTN